jgi:hypothetical protein
MLYSELLRRLERHQLAQVGRLTLGSRGSVTIANPKEICFPYQFSGHTLYAPAGEPDWEVTDPEVDALLRRFKIREL